MLVIESKRLRQTLRAVIPFVCVPLLAVGGAVVFDRKRHIIISLAIAALALMLFAAGYEKRSVGSRRMVIAAVMTALSFAGRFIPFLKPVTALAIITALYLGGEAGFLVGALTALLSNFYFGQGPWTAFQMLAWGIIGLTAGLLARPLRAHFWLLVIYGVVSGIAYSLIMDIWTVLWYAEGFDWGLYLGAITTALPYTASYVASNVLFLLLLAKPFGKKLSRVKQKYGI